MGAIRHSKFIFWIRIFPEYLGAVSDGHGERSHQDIIKIAKRYNGKWSAVMLADFYQSIRRETLMETITFVLSPLNKITDQYLYNL